MNEAEKKFHKNRITFAVVNDRMELLFDDERGHKEWLSEEYPEVGYPDIVMGYIMKDRIQFYTGEDFGLVDHSHIRKWAESLNYVHEETYGYRCECYYNGVEIGEPGDIWKAISLVLI